MNLHLISDLGHSKNTSHRHNWHNSAHWALIGHHCSWWHFIFILVLNDKRIFGYIESEVSQFCCCCYECKRCILLLFSSEIYSRFRRTVARRSSNRFFCTTTRLLLLLLDSCLLTQIVMATVIAFFRHFFALNSKLVIAKNSRVAAMPRTSTTQALVPHGHPRARCTALWWAQL